MKDFLGKDFLLNNNTAEQLYYEHAEKSPIIDYHNHLPPQYIQENKIFRNITEAWLAGDHYKWRAMRTNGVDERYITGEAPDEEKFQKWAETVPDTVRNPLYHWTHLELRRYFNIDTILNAETGNEIYEKSTKLLSSADYSCRGLLEKMNVKVVCSTDDPIDDLAPHKAFRNEGASFKMFPGFRPDKLYAIEKDGYAAYLSKLELASGVKISNFDDVMEAAQKRIDFFHENQCRISDHGIEQLYDVEPSIAIANDVLQKVLKGQSFSDHDRQVFMMTSLFELSKMYHAKGWVQQYHLGAIRNTNSRMTGILGPDTGYDSIGDFSQIRALSKFLNALDSTDQLTKTILYNLNPNNNEQFATIIGNFMDGSIPGKLQFGTGWWFLDQKHGMEKQMNDLSNMGLLARFVGMLTDSRSFLSFPRHEYFRRILCNLIGTDVENGELPADMDLLGNLVENICYNNARDYFNFPTD